MTPNEVMDILYSFIEKRFGYLNTYTHVFNNKESNVTFNVL